MIACFAKRTGRASAGLAGLAALSLAACSEPAEKTYDTRTQDQSGGEFIVNDADSPGVAVDVPETEMTPVPDKGPAPVEGAEMMERTQ